VSAGRGLSNTPSAWGCHPSYQRGGVYQTPRQHVAATPLVRGEDTTLRYLLFFIYISNKLFKLKHQNQVNRIDSQELGSLPAVQGVLVADKHKEKQQGKGGNHKGQVNIEGG